MKKYFSILLLIALFFIFPNIVRAKTVTPNELIEYTKTTDYYEYLTQVESSKWDLTYDNSTKKIRSKYYYKADDNTEINVDFYINYNEEGKYLEYIANTDKDTAIGENVYLGFIIYSLGEMFDYTATDIKNLMSSETIKEYTLETEGLYIETDELKDYVMSDGTKWNGKLIKKLQISLEDGFGNLESKPSSETSSSEESISNPKTSDTNIYMILLGILGVSLLIIIAKKKLSKV